MSAKFEVGQTVRIKPSSPLFLDFVRSHTPTIYKVTKVRKLWNQLAYAYEYTYDLVSVDETKDIGFIGEDHLIGSIEHSDSGWVDYPSYKGKNYHIPYYPKIHKVIFNAPATIVLWEDSTKTVVKANEDDDYDAEKGLAFCFLKKIYGSGYYKMIAKEVKETKCIKYW